MRVFIGIVLVVLGLSSCKNTDSSKQSSHEKEVSKGFYNDSIKGLYIGTLPCADCLGIKTELHLKEDYNFTLNQVYLETSGSAFTVVGNYTIKQDTIKLYGNTITPDAHQYLYLKDTLIKLNLKGERIKGMLSQKYKLPKKNF